MMQFHEGQARILESSAQGLGHVLFKYQYQVLFLFDGQKWTQGSRKKSPLL